MKKTKTNADILELSALIGHIGNMTLPIAKTIIKAKKALEFEVENILDKQKKIFNMYANMGENDEPLGIVDATGKRKLVQTDEDIDWKDTETGKSELKKLLAEPNEFAFKFESDDCNRKIMDVSIQPAKEFTLGEMLERKLTPNIISSLEDWKIIKNYCN